MSDEGRAPSEYRWARGVSALLLIGLVVAIVVLGEAQRRAEVLVPKGMFPTQRGRKRDAWFERSRHRYGRHDWAMVTGADLRRWST